MSSSPSHTRYRLGLVCLYSHNQLDSATGLPIDWDKKKQRQREKENWEIMITAINVAAVVLRGQIRQINQVRAIGHKRRKNRINHWPAPLQPPPQLETMAERRPSQAQVHRGASSLIAHDTDQVVAPHQFG